MKNYQSTNIRRRLRAQAKKHTREFNQQLKRKLKLVIKESTRETQPIQHYIEQIRQIIPDMPNLDQINDESNPILTDIKRIIQGTDPIDPTKKEIVTIVDPNLNQHHTSTSKSFSVNYFNHI